MTDPNEKIKHLLERLEMLSEKQVALFSEIRNLKVEVLKLKAGEQGTTEVKSPEALPPTSQPIPEVVSASDAQVTPKFHLEPKNKKVYTTPKPSWSLRTDLEKFIGENLISKIGIAITVLGVSIGAKYAIDHELISPLTRIILGYLFGLGLLGFAIKLKKSYDNFSAILLSGAMAIMYFITFAAHSFYDLIPQIPTFVLMVAFTAFTVLAAIKYNKQLIAHIGMVGAYAVPFLLSDGSGKVEVLFSYITVINIGILFIAFKRSWKPLYFAAFGLTWLSYFSWYATMYQTPVHFGLGLGFLSVFFVLFYVTFLAHALLREEKLSAQDVVLLLLNSFIFYGTGYAILEGHPTGKQLLGAFTLGNAVVHFFVCVIIYRRKVMDKSLFYLVSGLVLLFITITFPVQLDGNWVTLLWTGEAVLLFWIGRTKNITVYENLSYVLMVLAVCSLVHDWTTVYGFYDPQAPETRITPILNIHFVTSCLFIAAFGFINRLNRSKNYQIPTGNSTQTYQLMRFVLPTVFLGALYYTFRIEIENYWDQRFEDSLLTLNKGSNESRSLHWNHDLYQFKIIWVLNYTLFFLSVLSFVNLSKLKNTTLGFISSGLMVLTIGTFLFWGLYVHSELRESYLDATTTALYTKTAFHIGIRYVSFALVGLALLMCYRFTRQDFVNARLSKVFDFLLHVTLLWITSSELIHWMDIAASTQSYKLGLSILWGVYALFLIGLGIWKKKKHLRIGAIALFAVTLVKLFFYDISHLETIAKTIVLVSLGVLMLVVSFLYNKYKDVISEEKDNS